MAGYIRPDTVADAVGVLSTGRYRILAGGTDLYPMDAGRRAWGEPGISHRDSEPLLDISAIRSLRQIERADGRVIIGANVTWTDIADATLPGWFDGMRLAAREVGGRQIQNRATLIGNICNASPAADGVPPLLCLDAMVHVLGPRGARDIPVGNFIHGNRETDLRPDEFVTHVSFDERPDSERSGFLKLGARTYMVISIVSVAGHLDVDTDGTVAEARVAVGACSEVARRLSGLEERLVGLDTDQVVATVTDADLDVLSPIDDVRATAEYRRHAAGVMVRRLLASLAESASTTERAA